MLFNPVEPAFICNTGMFDHCHARCSIGDMRTG